MPRVIRCPNCRAPLDPGDEKRIVCRYCGVTSELDARRTLHPIAGMPAHRPGGSGKATLKVLLPGLLALGAVAAFSFMAVTCQHRKAAERQRVAQARQRTAMAQRRAAQQRKGEAEQRSRELRERVRKAAAERQRRRRQRDNRRGERAAVGDADTKADEAIGAQLSAYARCIAVARGATIQRRRYLGWVASKRRGPSCKERGRAPIAFRRTRRRSSCESAVDSAKEITALRGVREAARALVAALAEARPIVKQASRYYREKDFEDDGCKLGKALHPKLLASWAKVDVASSRLEGALGNQRRALGRRRLAGAQKGYGDKDLRVAFLAFFLRASELVDVYTRGFEQGLRGRRSKAPMEAGAAKGKPSRAELDAANKRFEESMTRFVSQLGALPDGARQRSQLGRAKQRARDLRRQSQRFHRALLAGRAKRRGRHVVTRRGFMTVGRMVGHEGTYEAVRDAWRNLRRALQRARF